MRKIYLIILIILLSGIMGCSKLSKKKEKIEEDKKEELVVLKNIKNEMIKLPKGSFVINNDVEAHLNEFMISKYKITNKEYKEVMITNLNKLENIPDDYLPITNLTTKEIAIFCNKKSIAEGLPPYYEITGNNVSENVHNIGYRLPLKEEYYYAAYYSPTSIETIKIEETDYNENIRIEPNVNDIRLHKESTSGITGLDFSEVYNSDIQNLRRAVYSGFHIVRNTNKVNTNDIRYTTRESYKFKDSYENYKNENFGLEILRPKNWGVKGIKKRIRLGQKNDTNMIKYEDGKLDEKYNGVLFYKSLYNENRLYELFIFNYEDLRFNIYNFRDKKKIMKTEGELIKIFSDYCQENPNKVKMHIKQGLIFMYPIDYENKNFFNMYIYKIENKNMIEIILRSNNTTELPKDLLETVFNSIKVLN